MGLKGSIAVTVLMIFCAAALSYGGWQGPTEILSGSWGTGAANFGIDTGDTSDRFPSLAAILFDGRIVISDEVNEREMIYKSDGTLLNIVPWYIYQNNTKIMNPDYPSNQYWNVQGYTPEGNVWIEISSKYALKSPTGQLIKTSTTRPTELGVVKSQKLGENNYKITVTYPDKVYGLSADRIFTRYVRDTRGFVYGVNAGGAWRFNQCGKLTGTVLMPSSDIQETPRPGGGENIVTVNAEYGEPVVAPNGDVYTWKREGNYSIIKWTWVDDPNVPSGPDAPAGLNLMPSTTGLYLTWTASAQDPGCVTGYEVSRATTTGGVGSTVATVNAGVVKYNDTTATAGTMYYYKIRAVAGSEYSPYTSEVSGKRP